MARRKAFITLSVLTAYLLGGGLGGFGPCILCQQEDEDVRLETVIDTCCPGGGTHPTIAAVADVSHADQVAPPGSSCGACINVPLRVESSDPAKARRAADGAASMAAVAAPALGAGGSRPCLATSESFHPSADGCAVHLSTVILRC